METKKMANYAMWSEFWRPGPSLWPERVKSFYNDVRTEMRKVTAPS